jgi:hypothetical protein
MVKKHHNKSDHTLPQLVVDIHSTSEIESPRIPKFWMAVNGMFIRKGTGKTIMMSASLKMTTTPNTMELKAIDHQISDSDGLVWEEKERVDVMYAMAHTSSRIPGTNIISPNETRAGHKYPKNARIAETMQNIEIKRLETQTPTNMNHVGRRSKM